jgi:hypothetical protein
MSRAIISALSLNEDTNCPRTELDSHADSPVVGQNCKILHYTGKYVDVTGFTDTLGECKSIPVVHCAVAFDCTQTQRTHILLINNALYMRSMKVNLIPPFAMRLNGIEVNECPKFLSANPDITDHSIYFPDENLRLPLYLRGIISYLPTRAPDDDDMYKHLHYNLTPPTSNWDPHTDSYANQEASMTNHQGEIIERKLNATQNNTIAASTILDDGYAQVQICSVLQSISPSLNISTFAASIDDNRFHINSIKSGKRKGITAKELSHLWRISPTIAQITLESTTQYCLRSAEHPSLSRRYKSNDRMLRYSRISSPLFMDTFFCDSKHTVSTRGNVCAQLYVSDFNYVHIIPMHKRSDLPLAMKSLFKQVGVPPAIICDGAREQVKGETRKLLNQVNCDIRELEAASPWSNRAELFIGIVKNDIKKDLKDSNCPMNLWDYCAQYRAQILSATARPNNYALDGQVPYTKMTGQPLDISNICEFKWYEWIYFRDHTSTFPHASEQLGRCLGPALNSGTAMSQWVLTRQGNVIPRQTLRKLTPSELISDVERNKRNEFDAAIRKRHGDSISPPPPNDTSSIDDEALDNDMEDHTMPDADSFLDYDEYINSEVLLPKDGEHMMAAKVIRRHTDDNGKAHGKHSANPILDTRVYDVMFPDGAVQQYSANIIAENIYNNVDGDGHQHMLLDLILDHRSTGKAVPKDDAYITTSTGKKHRRKTTKGWHFNIQWRDGSTTWVPLRELKESNPVQLAEYCTANKIDDEPAMAWWVPYTLKKKIHIVSAIKQRVKKTTHKYGVRVPKTLREAYNLDEENKNTVWRDAVKKEMENVSAAFDILDGTRVPSPMHVKLDTQIIFDVKMDFTRKARYVGRGDKVPPPEESTFAGVVSRDSVRIALTYAALNDLTVTAADIQNAYLQAPCTEKYYIICGPEFGPDNVGKKALVVRALYGLPGAGRDFRNHLRDCMRHLGYESCLADPDVWMRHGTKDNGEKYWEYMLLYVDDALSISAHGEAPIRELGKYFKIKESSIGPPSIYLGGKMSEVVLPNGVKAHAFSSSQYVQEAVRNVEAHLLKKNMKLKKKVTAPLTTSYRPELDASDELTPSDAAYFQSLIGILRWAVELGRIDITCEVSMLSSHLALPREGHLQQVYHIFAYLKCHHNSRIVFDPSYPTIDYENFPRKDWTSAYGELTEEIPDNAPESRGDGFIMTAYVDADHAGDKLTRRSRTGYLIFLNMSPIYWHSKKQTSVETSSFGSELVAMKQCTEYIRGLRYKLRMMGIPMQDPTYVYGDNKSVLCNTTLPESTLKKKSNSIAYHFVRDGTARDEWRITYVNTHSNPSDLMTKSVPGGEKRQVLVRMIMWDI